MKENKTMKSVIPVAICICAALFSLFIMPRITSALKVRPFVEKSLADYREDVAVMVATSATVSTVLAAVPDDSTTPIADQIANVCSYLMVVVGAITIEKYLFSLSNGFVFQVLIPIGMVMLGIFFISKKRFVRRWAVKLLAISALLYLLVPVSLMFGNYISDTFDIRKGIRDLQSVAEEAQEDTEDEGILDKLFGLGEMVKNTVKGAVDSMKELLNKTIDSVISLIIVTCAIPLVTLWLMAKVMKEIIRMKRRELPCNGCVPVKQGKRSGKLDTDEAC